MVVNIQPVMVLLHNYWDSNSKVWEANDEDASWGPSGCPASLPLPAEAAQYDCSFPSCDCASPSDFLLLWRAALFVSGPAQWGTEYSPFSAHIFYFCISLYCDVSPNAHHPKLPSKFFSKQNAAPFEGDQVVFHLATFDDESRLCDFPS